MPTSMATDLGLSLQEVDPSKYRLASANGSPIAVQFESTFTLELPPSRCLSIICLISNSLTTHDLIISWRAMILLGMLVYPCTRSVPSRSDGGVFAVSSPPPPENISQHSVLSPENQQVKLPSQNQLFLKNLPH